MIKDIPQESYEQILENMPVCCVDMVVHRDGKVLLVYRKNEPEEERWWVPGGRILKGERLDEAVKRKIKEEVGLDVIDIKFIGIQEYFSDKTVFENVKTGTHCIVGVYLVEVNGEVKLDSTSSDYKWIGKRWFETNREKLDDYVKKALKDSGVFN